MTLKAFIFDLDGVITDSAEFHYLAWKQLAEKLGVGDKFDRDYNEHLKGISRMASLEKILELLPEEDFTEDEKKVFAAEKNKMFVELIQQITPEDTLPGIKTLIESAKKAKLKLGIASASHNAPVILKNLELFDEFDIIVDPGTLRAGKPDPEIFIRAAELLDVDVGDCIGFEDAYSGVQAINDANMFSVAIGDPNVLKDADMNFDSTDLLNFDEIVRTYQQYNKLF